MKLSFCIINRCSYMLNMTCTRREKDETNFILVLVLSWTTLSHSSLSFIDSVKCSRTRISSLVKHASFSVSLFCLMMSIIDSRCLPLRIIPERICSSSSFFLFICICIYNIYIFYVCDPMRWQTWKYPCLLST